MKEKCKSFPANPLLSFHLSYAQLSLSAFWNKPCLLDACCAAEHFKMSCRHLCTPSRMLALCIFFFLKGLFWLSPVVEAILEACFWSWLHLSPLTHTVILGTSLPGHTEMKASGNAGHILSLLLQTLRHNLQRTKKKLTVVVTVKLLESSFFLNRYLSGALNLQWSSWLLLSSAEIISLWHLAQLTSWAADKPWG